MRIAKYGVIAITVIAMLAVNVEAGFMVETDMGSVFGGSGLANANYSGDGGESTWGASGSKALGTQALNAVFGGSGEQIYTFSYTPSPVGCLDVDNVTFAPGADLRGDESDIASGKTGGVPGLYNVYATWCDSENVPENNVNFTTTSEGDDVSLLSVQQYGYHPGAPPGSDTWLLIAERVPLVTGRTYTVIQEAIAKSAVSMRSHGVLWELVEPDDPLADIVAVGGAVSVEEGGETDQYTVVLKEQPPVPIVVTAQVCEPNQITLNGEDTLELTFTPQDWDVVRVIDVVAVEDSVGEPGHSLWIMHTADANELDVEPDSIWIDGFGGLITVNIRDYDMAVRITETDGTTAVSEEGPGSDDYMVKLLYAPTGKVTVEIATDGQVEVDTGKVVDGKPVLEFWPDDWAGDKPVTVTAVDDDVLEGDHFSTITHLAKSDLDGSYDGTPVRDVTVGVDDNECGAWGYSPMDLNDDCLVDLADLAKLAMSWLECTKPYGEGCVDLR